VNLKGYVTTKQAARIAGTKTAGAIIERIRSGELKAVKAPYTGRKGFRFVVKKSDVTPNHRGTPLNGRKPNGNAGAPLITMSEPTHAPNTDDALVGRLARRFPDLTGAALIELAEEFRS